MLIRGENKLENITSRTNAKIKFALSLRDDAAARRKSNMFFIEGARLCSDALKSGVSVLQFFFTESAQKKFPDVCAALLSFAKESYKISTDVALRLGDTKSPQGIFCVCSAVDKIYKADKIDFAGKYVLLENVQDPSNIGSAARTAEALGIDGLIVCGGCDVFNPKALRASMGAFFRLNIFVCDDAPSFLKSAGEGGMLTLASTPSAKAEKITDLCFDGGVICVVGNEGNGVEKRTMDACKALATIPMRGRAESLNASTAAAILMWEMVRHGD